MSYTYSPNNVVQLSDIPDLEIAWRSTPTTSLGYLMNSRWATVKSLTHLSNPACGDIRSQTWSLLCTQFNITELPEQISGLKLVVAGQRNGRVVDEIVQLTYQGQPIGSNKVDYKTDSEGHILILNVTEYGGSEDLWDAEITPEVLMDPSFGVILKFQSHPYYPHNTGMFLDSVSITVY